MTTKQFDLTLFSQKIKQFEEDVEEKYNLSKDIKNTTLQDLQNLNKKIMSAHYDLVNLQQRVENAKKYLADCEFSFDSIKNRAEKFHIDGNKNEGAL